LTNAVQSGTATVTAPFDGVIVPPVAPVAGFTAATLWPAANAVFGSTFTVTTPVQLARPRMGCTVAAGNIEIAVVKLNRLDALTYAVSKVQTTGRIACPTPSGGLIMPPFTTTPVLTPGDYAVVMGCDDVATAKFSWTNVFGSGLNAGLSISMDDMTGAGIPSVNAAVRYYSPRGLAITVETTHPRPFYGGAGDSITGLGWVPSANAQLGGTYQTVVSSYGGATAATIQSHFAADIAPFAPRVVSILAGTNDVAQLVPTATTTAAITSMINAAVTAGAARVILGVVPPRSNSDGTPMSAPMKSLWTAINTWIRAQGTATVKIADFAATALAKSGSDGIDAEGTLYSDYTHPNAAGQQILINTVLPLLTF
jgi:lysophospholipase L1-like esterase